MTSSFINTSIQIYCDPGTCLFELCSNASDCGIDGRCYTPYKGIVEPYICKLMDVNKYLKN